MSSSDLCSMVNILARAYCDLKLNNSAVDKNQLIFQTDFYVNKRIILFSLVNYEYTTNSNVTISRDELGIIREFLLTYINKFTTNTINDVYIHYKERCLIYSFVSYERSAVIADSCQTIKEIQNDIAINYENNIFKVIELFFMNFPPDSPITKIKNLYKYFQNGKNYIKCNINTLMNRSNLEKYCLSISNCSGNHPYEPNEPNEPYEPYEPNEPNEPSEPSEPSDYILLTKKIINNTTTMNENEIKAAISRILEITTSQEISNIPD
jgi:hypothetical protein